MRYFEVLNESKSPAAAEAILKRVGKQLYDRAESDDSCPDRMVPIDESPKGKAVLQHIMDADPTPKGIYVNWIVREYVKGNIARFEDLASRVRSNLNRYNTLKPKLSPEFKDVMRLSWEDVQTVVEEHAGVDTRSGTQKEKEFEQNLIKTGQAKVAHNDSETKIIELHSEEAAKFYGRNTRWCTAADENNMFDMYYKEDAPLYVLLFKKQNIRWQFHFDTDQYMDERDEPLNADQMNVAFSIPFLRNVALKEGRFYSVPNLTTSEIEGVVWYLCKNPPIFSLPRKMAVAFREDDNLVFKFADALIDIQENDVTGSVTSAIIYHLYHTKNRTKLSTSNEYIIGLFLKSPQPTHNDVEMVLLSAAEYDDATTTEAIIKKIAKIEQDSFLFHTITSSLGGRRVSDSFKTLVTTLLNKHMNVPYLIRKEYGKERIITYLDIEGFAKVYPKYKDRVAINVVFDTFVRAKSNQISTFSKFYRLFNKDFLNSNIAFQHEVGKFMASSIQSSIDDAYSILTPENADIMEFIASYIPKKDYPADQDKYSIALQNLRNDDTEWFMKLCPISNEVVEPFDRIPVKERHVLAQPVHGYATTAMLVKTGDINDVAMIKKMLDESHEPVIGAPVAPNATVTRSGITPWHQLVDKRWTTLHYDGKKLVLKFSHSMISNDDHKTIASKLGLELEPQYSHEEPSVLRFENEDEAIAVFQKITKTL